MVVDSVEREAGGDYKVVRVQWRVRRGMRPGDRWGGKT
jgi:hypothetical protein